MTGESHLSWLNTVLKTSDRSLANAMWQRAEKLRENEAPVLYSLKHLALSAGVDYGFLRGVIRRNVKAYREIRLPKNTGGYRSIQSPLDPLAQVQRWILQEILYKIPRHRNSFAYFPNVTTRDSASRHAGASWLIKTDIHDYFPSVTEKQVFRVFYKLGYSELLSFELARLCTWPPAGTAIVSARYQEAPPGSKPSYVYPETSPSFLPQGAPTSGALSNASTVGLDQDISKLALSEGFIYTRYSDDMVFSTTMKFDRARASSMVAQISSVVRHHGFNIHKNKTKLVPPGARKIVLGMLVGDAGISILPEQKRMIRLHIHGVAKFGPLAYANRRKFSSVFTFINHVEGWLAHLSSIDLEWTALRRKEWAAALEEHSVYLESFR